MLFDDTPVGPRRRRTMAEGMARLEAIAARDGLAGSGAPTLDAICAVVALDYLRFRFEGQPWLAALPALDALSRSLGQRASFSQTLPR